MWERSKVYRGEGGGCVAFFLVDKGVFEFENMSLLAISRQLSRWYGVSFQFEDESCAERRFTGGIKKYVPLNQSLDILEKTTNVVFKVSGRHVFIKSLKNEI